MKFTLEPDPEPRNTEYHQAIVKAVAIPHTRTGQVLTLQCGHVVQSFGDLKLAGGRVLCVGCRSAGRSSRN